MPLGPMNTKKQKQAGMHTVMTEFQAHQLHSGSQQGPVVTNPKQAIAIGLSQTGQVKPHRYGTGTAPHRIGKK